MRQLVVAVLIAAVPAGCAGIGSDEGASPSPDPSGAARVAEALEAEVPYTVCSTPGACAEVRVDSAACDGGWLPGPSRRETRWSCTMTLRVQPEGKQRITKRGSQEVCAVSDARTGEVDWTVGACKRD